MVTLSVQTQQTAPDKEADFANLLDSQTRALEVCTLSLSFRLWDWICVLSLQWLFTIYIAARFFLLLHVPQHYQAITFVLSSRSTRQTPARRHVLLPDPQSQVPAQPLPWWPLLCSHPEDPAVVALPVHSPGTYLVIYPFTSKMWAWSLKTISTSSLKRASESHLLN